MPEYRFYKQGPLKPGPVEIDEDEAHHLVHVMRLQPNDPLELVNGQGDLAQAKVIKCGKKTAIAEILSVKHEEPPSFSLIIAQAMPRFSRLDVILEKGTELGMTEIWLFPGERSDKEKFTEGQGNRIQKILIAAMKQCGTLHLPKLKWLPPLSEWQRPLPYPLFFGDVTPDAPSLIEAWHKIRPRMGVIFAVGPEKGFSEHELQILQEGSGLGVSLGKLILRTDTAPLAALSLLSALQHYKA